MGRDRAGIGLVWALAVVGSVVTLALAGEGSRQLWLGLTFGGCVLATFAVQLSVARADGYLARAMMSIIGAMVVIAVASGVAALLAV
ncbi:hypothetical protein [Rathayibacter toxicus]|uniref:Uncharacterized protein n=1 Tax=Rathayibacter toxicus TaxID=145458 RepID=A0A0C5BDE2_9MICO|nr:hypothetical protein [Rathayibacter toxicus]AJM77241.1 hypothetical protein TI83_03250 [Rathayibacter toxicus]ALS56898.1 hypothetical protein APU90_03225 [Rathayibacter toxicus]KKM46265.1 hypothetical protein VT73_04270 [Rathayibacter toxicus]PPG23229.1 hypothetical protein C5D15_03030 [Rathayibacter toxicus]PPG47813.1 hypothetical protein C5D16_03025 [Rathayibacter toxicus]